MDLSCDYAPKQMPQEGTVTEERTAISPRLHTSNIASITSSLGGVGQNIALAIHRASHDSTAKLCSWVADDL
jgi:pseudouridine-5'-phosphate glycosidase/pseudouridine kinase